MVQKLKAIDWKCFGITITDYSFNKVGRDRNGAKTKVKNERDVGICY